MKIYNLRLFYFLALLGLIIFVASCTKDSSITGSKSVEAKVYDSRLIYDWNELIIEIDRFSHGYRPPAASRAFAYIGLAVYESVVAGMPEYRSLSDEFPGMVLPGIDRERIYHWPTCANSAYAQILRKFYPHIRDGDIARINWLENKYKNQFSDEIPGDVFNRSQNFGSAIANAVFDYSVTDLYGHEAYLNPRPADYNPPEFGPNGEKLWLPTWPDYTPALFPYWGNVRTFAMRQGDLLGRPPLEYSEDPNSRFYQQALEVKLWVDNATYEDIWVAEFWSDDLFEVTFQPAARQIAIANQLVFSEKISLDRAVELYAKLGMAMSDAAVSVWHTKYYYNVLRPISYIRNVVDPNWKTKLNHPYTGLSGISPEFPAYPSGHSGFGGSGASILTDIFGDNKSFTDNCHINRSEFKGTPRTFSSFYEAGIENAYSRIPLGVHFRMDCDEGLRMGYLAAKRILELPWRK